MDAVKHSTHRVSCVIHLQPSRGSKLHSFLGENAASVRDVFGADGTHRFDPHCSVTGFFAIDAPDMAGKSGSIDGNEALDEKAMWHRIHLTIQCAVLEALGFCKEEILREHNQEGNVNLEFTCPTPLHNLTVFTDGALPGEIGKASEKSPLPPKLSVISTETGHVVLPLECKSLRTTLPSVALAIQGAVARCGASVKSLRRTTLCPERPQVQCDSFGSGYSLERILAAGTAAPDQQTLSTFVLPSCSPSRRVTSCCSTASTDTPSTASGSVSLFSDCPSNSPTNSSPTAGHSSVDLEVEWCAPDSKPPELPFQTLCGTSDPEHQQQIDSCPIEEDCWSHLAPLPSRDSDSHSSCPQSAIFKSFTSDFPVGLWPSFTSEQGCKLAGVGDEDSVRVKNVRHVSLANGRDSEVQREVTDLYTLPIEENHQALLEGTWDMVMQEMYIPLEWYSAASSDRYSDVLGHFERLPLREVFRITGLCSTQIGRKGEDQLLEHNS